MKNFKLNLPNVDGVNTLTREQLKIVIGGFFGASCEGGCTQDSDCAKGEYCDLQNPCSTNKNQKNPQCKKSSL